MSYLTTLTNKVTEQVVKIEPEGVPVFLRDIADPENWVGEDVPATPAAPESTPSTETEPEADHGDSATE